jgi:hypothetical protein
MKNLFSTLAIALISLVMLGQSEAADTKKGIGLTESQGLGDSQLQALQVAWYYNWGPQSQIKTRVPFVPMAFSPASIAKLPTNVPTVLGFNEPDNAKQSDLQVSDAVAAWPSLQARAKSLGAPATAGNPLKKSSWLDEFMHTEPKVDFITLHWYKGANAKQFIADVQALCDTYKKPVWITEFAPQTAGDAREKPDRFTQEQVDVFLQTTVTWMENSSCVQRYAWHDAKLGTSKLFEGKELSPTGKTYARLGQR